MKTTQTDNGPALGKWVVIMGAIAAAGLVAASIWTVARTLSKPAVEPEPLSPSQNSATPAGWVSGASQEEIEKQYVAEQRLEPATRVPAPAPAAAIPVGRNNEEVILQKTKAKVNQRLVERLKQYAKDHPNLDNRELEEQIKKREQQITPTP